MAWNAPPPVDNAQVILDLKSQRTRHQQALTQIKRQLKCNHVWMQSETNNGIERVTTVDCRKCGYQWY